MRRPDATVRRDFVGNGNPGYVVEEMNIREKYKTFGKNRSIRLKDFDYSQPYFVYFLTLCAYNKTIYFGNNEISHAILKSLEKYSKSYGYRLIAYCLMPDHLHFIVQAEENAKDLRDLIRDFKKFTTHTFWQLGMNGKLWQRGYFEHILRKNEDVFKVTEYVLNNPVRKGIVENKEDYYLSKLVNMPI